MPIKVTNPFAPHATGANASTCGECPKYGGGWCAVRAQRVMSAAKACEFGFRAIRAERTASRKPHQRP